MTVKEFIKKHGWLAECKITLCRAMIVHICFETANNPTDETSFDIRPYDTKELSDLFMQFCKENGDPTNTVTSVTIVAVASTMDELMKLSE